VTVSVSDMGAGGTGSNTLTVTVNNVAPVAVDDAYSVDEDTPPDGGSRRCAL